MTLTTAQNEIMIALSHRVGQTVEVLTSQYDANVAPDFRRRAIFLGTVRASSLRGLEAKGFIRVELLYWKGATITVLKGAEA